MTASPFDTAVVVEETTPCPSCGAPAELEEESEVRYWACPDDDCGHEFGYTQVEQAEGACAVGIPEEVRRAAGPALIGGPSIPVGGPHAH